MSKQRTSYKALLIDVENNEIKEVEIPIKNSLEEMHKLVGYDDSFEVYPFTNKATIWLDGNARLKGEHGFQGVFGWVNKGRMFNNALIKSATASGNPCDVKCTVAEAKQQIMFL